MDIREIIQEAWNKGEKLEKGADTFGAFLDSAADAISEAGYCKIAGKPPVLSDKEIEKLWRPIFVAHGFSGIYEASRAIAQAQLDKVIRFYEKEI